MVREPYATLSLFSRVETPHPGMKILSLLGEVVGVEGRAAWLSPTGLGSTLQGSTVASAPWKDGLLTAGSATYSPRGKAPFFLWRLPSRGPGRVSEHGWVQRTALSCSTAPNQLIRNAVPPLGVVDLIVAHPGPDGLVNCRNMYGPPPECKKNSIGREAVCENVFGL